MCLFIGKKILHLLANHSLAHAKLIHKKHKIKTFAHVLHCYWQECKSSYLFVKDGSIFLKVKVLSFL